MLFAFTRTDYACDFNFVFSAGFLYFIARRFQVYTEKYHFAAKKIYLLTQKKKKRIYSL